MFEENKWKELILSSGLNTIVCVIKDFYWDAYSSERSIIQIHVFKTV